MDRAWTSQASPLPGYTTVTWMPRLWSPEALPLKSLRPYFKCMLTLHLCCNTVFVFMYKLTFHMIYWNTGKL